MTPAPAYPLRSAPAQAALGAFLRIHLPPALRWSGRVAVERRRHDPFTFQAFEDEEGCVLLPVLCRGKVTYAFLRADGLGPRHNLTALSSKSGDVALALDDALGLAVHCPASWNHAPLHSLASLLATCPNNTFTPAAWKRDLADGALRTVIPPLPPWLPTTPQSERASPAGSCLWAPAAGRLEVLLKPRLCAPDEVVVGLLRRGFGLVSSGQLPSGALGLKMVNDAAT